MKTAAFHAKQRSDDARFGSKSQERVRHIDEQSVPIPPPPPSPGVGVGLVGLGVRDFGIREVLVPCRPNARGDALPFASLIEEGGAVS